jgi:hypothetical protein
MIDFKKLIPYIEKELKGTIEFKSVYFAFPKE